MQMASTLVKKLWLIPVAAGAAAAGWVIVASIPDVKRYVRMHEM
jgi:hypothetical protein